MALLALLLAAALGLVIAVLALYMARSTPIDGARWRDGEGERLTAGSRPFEQTVELLAGAPIRGGNRLEILANGDGTFPRLFDDLARAETMITWDVFWFRPGVLAERTVEVLSARARAGVRVLCLLDAFGSRGLGTAYVGRLRAAGVEVEVFRPLRWRNLYKVQQRLHARSVVIDGRVAYTGGFGIGDQWLGDGRTAGSWRETNLRVEGRLVDALQAGFVAHWAETTGELLVGHGVFSTGERTDGGSQAGLLHGVPTLGSTAVERIYVLSALRRGATRRRRARPDAGREHRSALRVARGPRALRAAARGGRSPLRVRADDDPRQDVRGGRMLVVRRLAQLRQPLDEVERGGRRADGG
jgi:cardiolipin synthase